MNGNMNDNGKRYWINRHAEQHARKAMSVIGFVLLGAVLCMALGGAFFYTFVCQVRGC